MSDRLCGCGTVIRNGKCAWGHVQPDAPQQVPVEFDFVRLGEKSKITRGTPIEKLPDRSDRDGWTELLGNRESYMRGETFEDVLLAKLNELIARINAMNEVSS